MSEPVTITLDGAITRAGGYVVGDTVTQPGRDEQDLMAITLNRPATPDPMKSVELWVRSGNVKIWENSWKGTEVALNAGKVTFVSTDIPAGGKFLWVEALAASTKLRDIELRYTYNGMWDTVKATAVWVKPTVRAAKQGTNPWYNYQKVNGFPDNPAPGPAGQLTNLTDGTLTGAIAAFRAADGSRYGHGLFGDGKGKDGNYGGRILWEFQVFPSGAETLGLKFDVTRQKSGFSSTIQNGQGTAVVEWNAYPWIGYPEQGKPPADNEAPNDDALSTDEQNTPVNGMLYSFDSPALNPDPSQAFGTMRLNFFEWVRVKLEKKAFLGGNGIPDGSRASDTQGWYVITYVKRGSTGVWEKDTAATSNNDPVFTGQGNGTAAVTLAATAVTEGYTATFSAGTQMWTLNGTNGGSDTKAAVGGTWTLNIPGRVTLVITPRLGGVKDKDQFVFSVFKTANPNGKQNEIGLGQKANP